MKLNRRYQIAGLALSASLIALGVSTVFAQDMGRPMPMEGTMERPTGRPIPCPSPVSLTLNVGAPNQADFSAASWALRVGLNYTGINKHFLGTFTWQPKSKCCELSSAILTVKMQANSGGASATASDSGNDGLGVVLSGGTSSGIGGPVYSNFPFPAGTQITKTYPITGSALAKLDSGGGLSFLVEDDTKVTSATLVIRGCCLNK